MNDLYLIIMVSILVFIWITLAFIHLYRTYMIPYAQKQRQIRTLLEENYEEEKEMYGIEK